MSTQYVTDVFSTKLSEKTIANIEDKIQNIEVLYTGTEPFVYVNNGRVMVYGSGVANTGLATTGDGYIPDPFLTSETNGQVTCTASSWTINGNEPWRVGDRKSTYWTSQQSAYDPDSGAYIEVGNSSERHLVVSGSLPLKLTLETGEWVNYSLDSQPAQLNKYDGYYLKIPKSYHDNREGYPGRWFVLAGPSKKSTNLDHWDVVDTQDIRSAIIHPRGNFYRFYTPITEYKNVRLLVTDIVPGATQNYSWCAVEQFLLHDATKPINPLHVY